MLAMQRVKTMNGYLEDFRKQASELELQLAQLRVANSLPVQLVENRSSADITEITVPHQTFIETSPEVSHPPPEEDSTIEEVEEFKLQTESEKTLISN